MEKRTKEIKVRLTETEYQTIQERKTKARLAEWLRELALDQQPKKQFSPIDPALLYELNRIGNSAVAKRREINISKYPSRASEIHTERRKNLCEHYKIDPTRLQNSHLRHFFPNGNNASSNRTSNLESQRNIQRYDRMATVSRDSQETDRQNQTIELWEIEQTLRSHRSGDSQRELSERKGQEKGHNIPNFSGVTNNDEHRATFRESIERIIRFAKSNTERAISKIRAFGAREQTISREIQRNQPTVSEFNAQNGQLKQNLNEISLIAKKSLKEQQSMRINLSL